MVTDMEIIESQDKPPPLCTVCIKAKMTYQPHRDVRPHSSQPGFRLHADPGRGGQTYATFWGFRYFIIFICKATGYVWVRFMKKKSEALSIFQNLVTLIFRQYGIQICILHTDFGKFNTDLAAKYFEESGIIWESSVPYAQQQNGLVERLIRTIVEGAQAMIIDSYLPSILWAKALTTMAYIKNRSPTPFTIQQSTVTSFQAWNHGAQPTIDHLRIFGSNSYVLHKSKPLPRLTTKTWIGYLVGYEGRYQYRIYDATRHAVFVRKDVVFDEASIGPNRDSSSTTLEAVLDTEVVLGFPSFSFFHTPEIDNTLLANTPTSTKHSQSIKTLHPIPDQPNVKDKNTSSHLSDIPDDFNDNNSIAETPLPSIKTDVPAQRQLARLKTQPPQDY